MKRYFVTSATILCIGLVQGHEPGDVMVVGYDASSPDSVAFVTWVELAVDETITIADAEYLGGGDGSGEGAGGGSYRGVVTMDWTNTSGFPVAPGTVIVVGDDGSTSLGSASGSLPLTNGGEQFFLVQGNFSEGTFSGDLLFGLDFEGGGTWGESNESLLPGALDVIHGNLSFPDLGRWEYAGGRRDMELADFPAMVVSAGNWSSPGGELSAVNFEESFEPPMLEEDRLGEVSKGLIFQSRRLNDREPIIDEAWMLAQGGTANESDNINGPSCIRIPDWIAVEDRPDPSAIYYLYFGHHAGDYIRMAWAADIEGPWTGYRMSSALPLEERGVLSLGDDGEILPGNDIVVDGHIASPQVFVDEVNERFIMYYHGPSSYDGTDMGQSTVVATSADGLNFNLLSDGGQPGHGTQPVILGESYFRVFQQAGDFYAFSNTGDLWKAPDPLNPFTPPAGYDYSKDYWDRGPNPFVDEARVRGWPELRPRHFAVHSRDNVVYAFLTYKVGRPERVKVASFDFDDLPSDYLGWKPDFPEQELMRAETEWEGAQFPETASESGSQDSDVNQLRDPGFFQDIDGRTYLFYSGQGENAIGVAQVVTAPKVSGDEVLVRGRDHTFQVETDLDVAPAVRRISRSFPVEVSFDGEAGDLPFLYSGSGGYAVLQEQTVATGAKAFQLAHLGAEAREHLTFPERYYARPGAALQFRSRRGVAKSGQVGAVQISFDGSQWETLWIQTSEVEQSAFQQVRLNLEGVEGRLFNLRFSYEHEALRNTSFSQGSGHTEGWFLDDIQATGLEAAELLDEVAFAEDRFSLESIIPILDPFLADGTGEEDRFVISVNGGLSGSETGFGKPFVVRVKTSYEQFLDDHFTEEEQGDALVSGEMADPDRDGLSNLLEHVFGEDPRVSNGAVVEITSSSETTLRFPWNVEANFTYQLQWSRDLNSFKDVPYVENTSGTGPLIEVRLTPDLSLEDVDASSFFRIGVEPR